MKILQLTLKAEFFKAILSGEKTVEHRINNPYWESRLLGDFRIPLIFDEILFVNGYGKHRPWMRVEFVRILLKGTYPDFRIYFGDIIKSGNLRLLK